MLFSPAYAKLSKTHQTVFVCLRADCPAAGWGFRCYAERKSVRVAPFRPCRGRLRALFSAITIELRKGKYL